MGPVTKRNKTEASTKKASSSVARSKPATSKSNVSTRVEKDMGKAERVAPKALSGPKAAPAAPKASLASRLRTGLKGAGGKAGMLGLLATGAGLAMSAGHALDEKVAQNRAEAGNVKDNPSAGPRRTAASTKPKTPAKAPAKASPAAPEKKAAAAKSSTKASSKPSAKKGDYPVYPKNSSNAASFRQAFASARKTGQSVFTWEGRKYNTKLKG